MDDGKAPQNPKPARADRAQLVKRLLDLRNALQEAALALSDYRCMIDSDERRAAQHQMLQAIGRAKTRDYSAGDGR